VILKLSVLAIPYINFVFLLVFFLPLFPFLIPVGFLGVFPLLGSVKVAPASRLSVFHFPFLPVFVIDEAW
jgi:hypothetical protein